jgi:hypothetical protein
VYAGDPHIRGADAILILIDYNGDGTGDPHIHGRIARNLTTELNRNFAVVG